MSSFVVVDGLSSTWVVVVCRRYIVSVSLSLSVGIQRISRLRRRRRRPRPADRPTLMLGTTYGYFFFGFVLRGNVCVCKINHWPARQASHSTRPCRIPLLCSCPCFPFVLFWLLSKERERKACNTTINNTVKKNGKGRNGKETQIPFLVLFFFFFAPPTKEKQARAVVLKT